MRTATTATKAVRALTSAGISALRVSIDPALTRRGCGFGVSVMCRNLAEAKRLLEKKHIPFGDVLGGI